MEFELLRKAMALDNQLQIAKRLKKETSEYLRDNYILIDFRMDELNSCGLSKQLIPVLDDLLAEHIFDLETKFKEL